MDSDDEQDWEEVQVPEQQQHLEITLNARPKAKEPSKKKLGISHAERMLRIDCHKIHTICLLANARVRNTWISDPLLHARLLSLTPLSLQNSFAMIHKSRVPEQAKRGRMFEAAMLRLVEWWYSSFFEVLTEGHVRSRTFESVQSLLKSHGVLSEPVLDTPLALESLQDILDDEGEQINSPKSLMKHTLMQSGSRDTSAQLFTALCRALNIPARLVVSLQSVPWQVGIGKPKYSKKGKGKAKESDTEAEDMEEVVVPSPTQSSFPDAGRRLDGVPVDKSEKVKGKEKAKQVKLRKPKSKGYVLGGPAEEPRLEDPTLTPPVFWTEVFSRADGRWIPVDPLRATVNRTKPFDPSSSSSTRSQNRMVYVVAFEEDGYARDVTRRYARTFGAKVAKLQGGSSSASMGGSKGRLAWWEGLMSLVTRPYRLNRDDVEDDEFEIAQITEGMPTTMAGFKDHPLYVLTRHLKQTETIFPPPPSTPELGKFRGEPVYPRSAVVSLKTPENWLRSEGRVVKEGMQPLKSIKVRASTLNRQRELEIMKDGLREAGEEMPGAGSSKETVMQGLYTWSQTEVYQPEPVVDGKVPKNNFGNIDLYVKSMLPAGAVHIPFKGVAKIAKKLGFDYAEAVTGFEFKKRRAYPIVEGIVVAQEHEPVILEAYIEAEKDAEEKARLKRDERVLKRWKKLIHGLRIRQRLQEQYAHGGSPKEQDQGEEPVHHHHAGGGFLTEADDVVQAFQLPRPQFIEEPTPAARHLQVNEPEDDHTSDMAPEMEDLALEEEDVVMVPLSPPPPPIPNGVPKSMTEMAEEAARLRLAEEAAQGEPDEEYSPMPASEDPPPPSSQKSKRKTRSATSKGRSKKRAREDDADSDEDSQPTPTKRNKPRGGTSVPTRTLRPRTSKNYSYLDNPDEDEE